MSATDRLGKIVPYVEISGVMPLPVGASTSANQATQIADQITGNASLASIDGKVSTAAKQDTGNVSLASIDAKVSTAANQVIGNASMSSIDGKVSTSAKQDTGNVSLASIDTKTPALGYAVKITEAGAITYVGKAATGSAQASAVWQAQKLDSTAGLIVTWADGNLNFDNVATDLTALAYS